MRSQSGFTLTEFLIILGLVVILFIIFSQQLQNSYIPRARDAERKTDLERVKIAFEDYYNDNGCYPDPEQLQNCNSDDLQPYLQTIPCDPETKEPYYYEPDPDNQCGGYRLLTELRYKSDPEITSVGCPDPYNYGVSVGVPLVTEACAPAATGSPTPSVIPSTVPSPSPSTSPTINGSWACDPEGACNHYSDPLSAGCPETYATYEECAPNCSNPAMRCSQWKKIIHLDWRWLSCW